MGSTNTWAKGLSTFNYFFSGTKNENIACRGYKIVPLFLSFETAFESPKLDLKQRF